MHIFVDQGSVGGTKRSFFEPKAIILSKNKNGLSIDPLESPNVVVYHLKKTGNKLTKRRDIEPKLAVNGKQKYIPVVERLGG